MKSVLSTGAAGQQQCSQQERYPLRTWGLSGPGSSPADDVADCAVRQCRPHVQGPTGGRPKEGGLRIGRTLSLPVRPVHLSSSIAFLPFDRYPSHHTTHPPCGMKTPPTSAAIMSSTSPLSRPPAASPLRILRYARVCVWGRIGQGGEGTNRTIDSDTQ